MPSPIVGSGVARAVDLSKALPDRQPQHRRQQQWRPQADPAHRIAASGSSRVLPPSDDMPPAPRATARSSPGNQGCRSALPRCAAARAKSSMALFPTGRRPPAHRDLPPVTARSPRARQSSGNARTSAWTNVTDATEPYLRPCETSETRPAVILQPSSPRPRSRAPRRSTPRTVADAPATLQEVALAIAACPAVPDPNVVDPPSHHPPSRCCDNQLNPPWAPLSEWCTSPPRWIGLRSCKACSSASSTKLAYAVRLARQPTMRRA